jgi:hypothetical protein
LLTRYHRLSFDESSEEWNLLFISTEDEYCSSIVSSSISSLNSSASLNIPRSSNPSWCNCSEAEHLIFIIHLELIFTASARHWISLGFIRVLWIISVRRPCETWRTTVRELMKQTFCVMRLIFNVSAHRQRATDHKMHRRIPFALLARRLRLRSLNRDATRGKSEFDQCLKRE